MNRCSVPDGQEIRGFRLRVYPTADQARRLAELQETQRKIWNWLVARQDEVTRIRGDYAIRMGVVGPRPTRPDYNGMSPDESKAACSNYAARLREWSDSVHKATKDDPVCAYRSIADYIKQFGVKHDYQFFNIVATWMECQKLPRIHRSSAWEELVLERREAAS